MNARFLNTLASMGIVGCTLGGFTMAIREDPPATIFMLVIGAICWVAYFRTRDLR